MFNFDLLIVGGSVIIGLLFVTQILKYGIEWIFFKDVFTPVEKKKYRSTINKFTLTILMIGVIILGIAFGMNPYVHKSVQIPVTNILMDNSKHSKVDMKMVKMEGDEKIKNGRKESADELNTLNTQSESDYNEFLNSTKIDEESK
jgi:hypothetical protein